MSNRFPVMLNVIDANANGTNVDAASFEYECYDAAGKFLGNSAPERKRQRGRVRPATIGVGYFDDAKVFHLYDAVEIGATE